jgi:hypothetical protein
MCTAVVVLSWTAVPTLRKRMVGLWMGYRQKPQTTAAWAVVNGRRQVVALHWFGRKCARTN